METNKRCAQATDPRDSSLYNCTDDTISNSCYNYDGNGEELCSLVGGFVKSACCDTLGQFIGLACSGTDPAKVSAVSAVWRLMPIAKNSLHMPQLVAHCLPRTSLPSYVWFA